VFAAIAVMTAIAALAVGIGALTAGSDALTTMVGTITLGLYAAAVAGVGSRLADSGPRSPPRSWLSSW
jgi:hypothetical protein